MPWKDGYTISDEIGQRDADVRWPDAARLCLRIVVDLSVASGTEGITARDMAAPPTVFGMHDGLDGLLRVLDRFALKATFATPAAIARAWPERIRAIAAAGHEIAANGLKGEDVSKLARDEEAARIARTTAVLADIAGARPSGWFTLPRPSDRFAGGECSTSTMALLLDAGYGYFGNSLADDIPHWWVTDFAARHAILALPYYYHYDDRFFLLFPAKGTGLEHADSLARNWRAEFSAQYRRGRTFAATVSPVRTGFAHRLGLFEDFLGWAVEHPGVWNATSAACAAHWQATFPAATHLRLEPSIWQDHPGSLS
jgi:peptidoglycan/xylan/chitin deacetylase (PgdA/CDA1 family)